LSAGEYDKVINQIRRLGGINPSEAILPSPLGPIGVTDLPFLQWWRYNSYSIGFPGAEIPLVNGGPAATLVDYTDEMGWVLFFLYQARSPYCTLNFSIDNLNFSVSPFLLQAVGATLPNNALISVGAYNPATPLGPLYTVQFAPAYAMPYQSKLQITLSLPATVPVAATTLFAATVGKIHIVDHSTFMRSVKRYAAEQMVGKKVDRYL